MSKIFLSQCSIINMGQSPESESYNETGDGLPFYQGNADFGELYPVRRYYCSRPTKIADKNDILLSVRAPIGAVNIATEKCCIGRGLCAIKQIENVSFYKYLYYLLISKNKELNAKGTGSTFKAIGKDSLTELQIDLPPINEQKKIAEILDKASNLISLRKKQIEKMDLLIKARFIEMFGDPESNPKKWPVKKIADVIEESPQNGLYKPASDYTNDGSGIPILRIDAFYDGKVTNFRYLKRLNCTEKELELYQLHEGDIVINRVNSIEYLGKCALIKGLLENTVFESNMMRFKVKDNILNPFFVTKLLCTKHLYNQIISHAKKAVNQASINQKDVQDFEIYVPPKDLQDAFAEFVEYIEAQELELKNGLEKLELTYKALMQQYFN